jgi:hypothetical protein
LADQYEVALGVGRRRIQERWRFLTATTQEALQSGNAFTPKGTPVPLGDRAHGDDVERLEYSLGVLKLCVEAKLPERDGKGAAIPREALTDDVYMAVDELLFVPEWRDSEFLRLALAAVAAHRLANSLLLAGPPKKNSSAAWALIGGFLKLFVLWTSPIAAANALASAFKGDIAGCAFALYFVALAAWLAFRKPEPRDPTVLDWASDHGEWSAFRHMQGGTVIGTGARMRLEQMERRGVNVPAVAYDICRALEIQASTTACPVIA